MQDSVYSHPFLQRAARGAISILLHLIDCPEDIDGLGHLSSADRKKEKTRLKKRKEKELKAFEDKEKAQVEEAKWNGKDSASEEQKDLDPFGEKILQKNYLAECSAWCTLVAPFRVDGSMVCGPDTLALVCDVMIRRGKYVPAARALSVGLKSHPNHPALSVMLVKFASKVGGGASSVGSSAPQDVKPLMQSAVSEELSLLLGPSVASFSTAYTAYARESNSVDRRVAAAKICVAADKGPTGKAVAVRLIVEEEMWAGRGVTAASLQTAMMVRRSGRVVYFLSVLVYVLCLRYCFNICILPSPSLNLLHASILLGIPVTFFVAFCVDFLSVSLCSVGLAGLEGGGGLGGNEIL